MTPVQWVDLEASELDAGTLYDVLTLRVAVFVVEQECPYPEVDGLDLLPETRHLVGRLAGELAAYARILPPGEHPTPRIGRVVVAPQFRSRQLARQLMERALRSCAEHWPGQPIELGGQAHLTGFYASLGFTPVGAVYDEDGIAHQWMRREPT